MMTWRRKLWIATAVCALAVLAVVYVRRSDKRLAISFRVTDSETKRELAPVTVTRCRNGFGYLRGLLARILPLKASEGVTVYSGSGSFTLHEVPVWRKDEACYLVFEVSNYYSVCFELDGPGTHKAWRVYRRGSALLWNDAALLLPKEVVTIPLLRMGAKPVEVPEGSDVVKP